MMESFFMSKKQIKNMNSKALAFSAIAIVALLGILAVSLWSFYQLSTGSQYAGSVTGVSSEDQALTKLETTKNFLSQNLAFATEQAELDVAAQGGTQLGTTYWYCNGPTPPSSDEINYAMSSTSINYMNSYIKSLKENKNFAETNTTIKEYGCCDITDPGEAACLSTDSSACESFLNAAKNGGEITITDPSFVTYKGDLSATTTGRLYWIYHNLYKDTKDNMLVQILAQGFAGECPGTQYNKAKLEVAVKNSCQHFKEILDSYVDCEYKIDCLGCTDGSCDTISCLNSDCKRNPIEQSACGSSTVSASGTGQSSANSKIKMQGGSIGSARIKYTLTDNKYNIPSDTGPRPLKFIFDAVIDIPKYECTPIDKS
jgi:hypothetical protein